MRRIMSTGTAAVRRHNLHRLDFSIASALPVGATKNALLPDIALFHHCELVQIKKKLPSEPARFSLFTQSEA